MIINTARLFYLTSFRDYKKYWLKTLLSLVGLVFGIALTTVVSIYTNTIEHQLTKNDFISDIYPSNFIYDPSGFLTSEKLEKIFQSSSISHGYPFKKKITEITINDRAILCDLIGIDIVYLQSFFTSSKEFKSNHPIILLTNNESVKNKKEMDLFIYSSVRKVSIIYDQAYSKPILLLDISLLNDIFNEHHIDRLYVESNQFETFNPEPFKPILTQSVNNDSSTLSDAFFVNLQFIGYFSILISILLVYLFFKFLEKHRQFNDRLLHYLGAPLFIKRLIRIFESVLFIAITTALGLVMGIILSQLGINMLSNTLNTLYYSISLEKINVDIDVILNAFFISFFSVFLAMNPFFDAILHKLNSMKLSKKIGAIFFMTAFSIFLLGFGHLNFFPAYRSFIGVLILSFSVSASLIWVTSYFFQKLAMHKFLFLKTAAHYFRKDIYHASIIVLAISLAFGLFISMAIFIHSFELSLKDWIYRSTTSDIYIQNTNNSIPTPIPLSSQDIQTIIRHPASLRYQIISRANIFIKNKPVILRGVPFHHLNKQTKFVDLIYDHPNKITDQDVFISEAASRKLGLAVGDPIQIETPNESFSSIVSGIYIDYATELGVVTISETKMKSLYGDLFEVHSLWLMTNPAHHSSLFSKTSHLMVQTKEELRDYVIKMFNQTFLLTWLLASLSGLIALFVLINMLSIMVIDRREEMVQIYSIGGQHHHLRHFIFSHAFWIGSISIIMSYFVGFILSFVILKRITPSYFGWEFDFSLPIYPMIYLFILMVLIILLTAYSTYQYILRKVTFYDQINDSVKTYYFNR